MIEALEIAEEIDVVGAVEARYRLAGYREDWIEAHMESIYAIAERAGVTAAEIAAGELEQFQRWERLTPLQRQSEHINWQTGEYERQKS